MVAGHFRVGTYPYVCAGSMSKPFRAGADPRFDHIGMR
jgi:hypothetical protein